MNVLIVEDDDDKLDALAAFLRVTYPDVIIETAKSLQSGLRSALHSTHNLMLLDMTMKNFDRTVADDGGRPHAFAGREILRQMQRAGVVTPTIVVTHFEGFGEESNYQTLDELKKELAAKFSNYLGTVQYRGNVDEWKTALASLIDGSIGAVDGN